MTQLAKICEKYEDMGKDMVDVEHEVEEPKRASGREDGDGQTCGERSR